MANKLESLIRKAGRDLADWQVARIFKVPEEMTQTPCDFFGYTTEARAILIECKMVSRTSLPIGKSPGLAPHQWIALEEANRANCLALICWMRYTECAVISMDMAQSMSLGRKSISWQDIPERYIHTTIGADAHLHLLEPFLVARQ